MAHDDAFLSPGHIEPHEKYEETGHPDRKKKVNWDALCPCGCGQDLDQQDEGFGEPEQKE